MRFLVMVKATEEYEAGAMPTKDEIGNMQAFNEGMGRDGWFVDAGGIQPSRTGVRIDFAGTTPRVIDGPFAETKELVAGFWVLEAPSRDELVERLKQLPFKRGEQIEIRQFFTMEDFAGIL